MKLFATLVLGVAAFSAALPLEEDLDQFKELAANSRACIERTGVTLQEIEELRTNPKSETPKTGMCYIKCMAELSGLEKDGLIQKDVAVTVRPEEITKEEAEKFIEECSKLDADEPCERSYIKYIYAFLREAREKLG